MDLANTYLHVRPRVVKADGKTLNMDMEGMWQRSDHIKENREVEVMGRQHVDMFLQDCYLLNSGDV